MTKEQLEALTEIRRLLREAYADYFLRGDGCHKSSDGYIEIHYPPCFVDGWDSEGAWGLMIYSYALGPSRKHYWRKGKGNSDYAFKYSDDPFGQALADVKEWHREQMESEDE